VGPEPPIALDQETTPATEAPVGVQASAAGPGYERRRSLLGTYPVPAPHLVGTPPQSTPGQPSRWRPPPPPLQYGVDYTFLRRHGSRVVRWEPNQPITVRLCGPHQPEQATTLAAVVAELAGCTGLSLTTGEPRVRYSGPKAVPTQEIHVGFVAALPAAPFFRPCAGQAGVGGALADRGASHYTSGFVTVATSAIQPRSSMEIAVLRHELAHAVGLGHAARPGLLMYHRISAATVDFGRGDLHGLTLLNETAHPDAV
jgi:Matrixin